MSVRYKKSHKCDCNLARIRKLFIILISTTLILNVNSMNELNKNRDVQSADSTPYSTNNAEYTSGRDRVQQAQLPRLGMPQENSGAANIEVLRQLRTGTNTKVPRTSNVVTLNSFLKPALQSDLTNIRYDHQYPSLQTQNRNDKQARTEMPTNPNTNYQGNSQTSTVTDPHRPDSYANRMRQGIFEPPNIQDIYNEKEVYDQQFPSLQQANKKIKLNKVPLPQDTSDQLNRQVADKSGPDADNTPKNDQNINRVLPEVANYGIHQRPEYTVPQYLENNRRFQKTIPQVHLVTPESYNNAWHPRQFHHALIENQFVQHIQPALQPAMNNHEMSQVRGPAVRSVVSKNWQQHRFQPSLSSDPIGDSWQGPMLITPNVHEFSHYGQPMPAVNFHMKNLGMPTDMADSSPFYTNTENRVHPGIKDNAHETHAVSEYASNNYDTPMQDSNVGYYHYDDLYDSLHNAQHLQNQRAVGSRVNGHPNVSPLESHRGMYFKGYSNDPSETNNDYLADPWDPSKLSSRKQTFEHQSPIDIDDSRIVHLYDRQTTLKKLFGAEQLKNLDSKYTSGNEPLKIIDYSLTTGDLESLCDGKPYIDRRFQYRYAGKTQIGTETDTPTVIAENLRRGINNFVVLEGPFGTGKSVSLGKILHELRHNSPEPRWSVIIDCAVLANSKIVNPVEIFADSMNSEQRAFFRKMFHLKPDRVDVLIDNIVKIPSERRGKVIQFLEVLNQNGVGIVITHSPGLVRSTFTVPVTNVQLPEPTVGEAQIFLKHHWLKGNELQTDFLDDYAKTLLKTLIDTPIPRDFKTLKQLAIIFYDQNDKIFGQNRENFQSVSDYLNNNVRNTIGLTRTLQTLALNKFNLYEAILEAYVNLDHSEFYSYVKLKKVILEWADKYQTVSSTTFLDSWPISVPPKQHEQSIHYDTFKGLCTHPQYHVFVVARLIIERLAAKDNNIVRVTEILLQQKEFSYLLEFFNSKILKEELFEPVITSIAQNTETWNRAMDTAISYGFDNIALMLIRTVKNPQILRNYFIDVKGSRFKLLSKVKYRLGVMINGDESINSRQQLLFKMNMVNTIMKITNLDSNLNIWTSDLFVDYFGKFFEFEKRPQLKLFKLLQNYYTSKNVDNPTDHTEFYNRLMYEAIKHGGLQNRKILQRLLTLGIDPNVVRVNGETLIHIAVKAMDPLLLHYLVNDLQISITDATIQSLLITALDANPLPYYSPPNFWRVMLPLIKSGNIRVPQPFDEAINRQNVIPSTRDIMALPYKLMIGTDDHQLISQTVQDLERLPNPFQYMSPELLRYRRNLVLSRSNEISTVDQTTDDATTLAEVILKYRGLDRLNVEELHAYQESFHSSLHYNDQFNDKQARRIGQLLFENLGTDADRELSRMALKWMKNKISENVWEEIHHKMLAQPKIEFHNRLTPNTLENGMMRSRMDYFSVITDAHMILSPSESELKIPGSPCENSRRRRRSLCHISDNEYKELIPIDDKDQSERRIVDVDKFMDLMDDARLKNPEKYDQLIKLGRRLLEDEGLEPSGSDVELFKEHVLFEGQDNMPELIDRHPSETHSKLKLRKPDVRNDFIHPYVENSAGKMHNLELGQLNTRINGISFSKPHVIHENTIAWQKKIHQNHFDHIRPYGSYDFHPRIEPKITIKPYPLHEIIVKPQIPELPMIGKIRFTPKTVPRMITTRG